MSHETFHPVELSTDARPRRLKRLIDHLVSLAPFADEPTVAEQASQIIQELKATDEPVQQLGHLEKVTLLSLSTDDQDPDQTALHKLIDNTAGYLVEELDKYSPTELKSVDSLSSAWTALKAWDIARTPATYELCQKILGHFWGVGRHQLLSALELANEQSISFDEALDIVNERERRKAA